MRVLLIGEDPFVPHRYGERCSAKNSGNRVFQYATYAMLRKSGFFVETMPLADLLNLSPRDIETLSARIDAVFSPALLLNPKSKHVDALKQFTAFVQTFEKPFFCLGVGSEFPTHNVRTFVSLSRAAGYDKVLARFYEATESAGGGVGLRGEFTQSVFRSLGLPDVPIFSCPSVFYLIDNPYWGRISDSESSHSLEGSDVVAHGLPTRKLVRLIAQMSLHSNVTYLCQDVFYGRLYCQSKSRRLWRTVVGRPFAQDLSELTDVFLFQDFPVWRAFLQSHTTSFVFGTRLHGSIAALLSGLPAVIWADSVRVLEVAESASLSLIKHMPHFTESLHFDPAPTTAAIHRLATELSLWFSQRGIPWQSGYNQSFEDEMSRVPFNYPSSNL